MSKNQVILIIINQNRLDSEIDFNQYNKYVRKSSDTDYNLLESVMYWNRL